MKFNSIIKVAYLAFTFYALLIIDVTSLRSIEVLPAVFLMWLIYFIFNRGYKLKFRKRTTKNIYNSRNTNSWILNKKKKTVFLISILSILASVLAAYFYTGQTPISVAASFFDSNRSLYAEYQLHAKNQNISIFTIKKIPYILMMFYIKLIFFYMSISFILIKNKLSKFQKFCLLMVTGAHIYFGLARGTNYELFELVILVIFMVLSRKNNSRKNKIPLRNLLVIIISIGVMIFLFYVRISARGFKFDYRINPDFTFEPRGIISIIFTDLAFVIILLYDYFGFGFYYVSNFIVNIWFASLENFIGGLIPFGFVVQRNGSIQKLIGEHIIMSTRWHPDIILSINIYGIIISFIIIFLLGMFAGYLRCQKESSLVYLSQFLILMQMISFPIGNFVFVSSASTLIVLLLVAIWLWKILVNKKIKF